MNILFLNKLSGYWQEQYNKLKAEFPKVEFIINDDPNERVLALKHADAVIAGRLTAEEIEQSPNLKAIIVPFTGLNNFPVDLMIQRNIILYNTHANAPYVAERAVTLALALLGRVSQFHDDLKRGKWSRTKEIEDMWSSIRNKNIGILGYGHIGKYIAKYLKVFDCKITGFKRSFNAGNDEYADEISNDLEYVISKSMIIFNTLPLNPETKGIINAEIIAKMKGKYIISVGRGETIHEEPLYNALKDNILAGAALDVWYNYPGKNPEPVMPANFPFWELPNVLLSPHKSSHTIEAVNAMIDDTCNNIRKVISEFKL